MVRGLLAPLSPNEEITLRRIAVGTESALPSGTVRRLERLELIEPGQPNGWKLTALGQQRYAALPRPAPGDEIGHMLSGMRKPESN